MLTKFIGISGMKKVGKTTTIETLVPKLKKLGFKVGTVKVAFKDVSIDVDNEHYDVIRHRKVDPDKTLFKSSIETTIFINNKMSLRDSLRNFGKDLDLVLIEGFKENLVGIPQIVLLKEKNREAEFVDDFTVAISSIPEFSISSSDKRFIAFEKLVDITIEKSMPLFPELDCNHCGYDTCDALVKAIISGEKEVTDCYVLETEISDLQLKVNDKIVPCNPFVRTIMKNTIIGVLKAIKIEEDDFSEIDIKILLDKEAREEIKK
jgi:molybdopterin-guanine dinucleotide biosynthesis protein B